MMNNVKNQSGFTLIEITIVVLISSIVIAALFSGFNIYMQKRALATTKERKEQIELALNAYMARHFALPCPAPLNGVGANDPAYGRQTACLGGPAPTSTFRVNGRNNNNVHIGAVPAFDADINLPADVMVDGWGNLFTYAVTESMTAPNSVTSFEQAYSLAAIEVRENTQTLSPPDPANTNNIAPGHIAYVVLSHGPRGTGAFTPSGVRAGVCPAAALEGQNCDYDSAAGTTAGISDRAVFVSSQGFSQGANNQYFDDVVSYAARVAVSNWPDHRWCNPGTGVFTGIQFQNPDLSWGPCVDLRGPKGPEGIKGDVGPPGFQGPPGGLTLSDALCPAGQALTGFTETGEKVCVTNDGSVPDYTISLEEVTKITPPVTTSGSPAVTVRNQPFATAVCPDQSIRVSCSGSREELVRDGATEENGDLMGTVDLGTDSCLTGVDFAGEIEAVATAYCLKVDY